ncbi:hypothetical protein KHP62_09565 [Rhodobacteraceae bacterium NNCM2]|nr:hypothetical protein [Coraliihabitans acroporae]
MTQLIPVSSGKHLPLMLGMVLAISGCKTTEEAMAEKGIAPMTGDEIMATMNDASVRQTGDGWVWVGYYKPDGTMVGMSTWDGGTKSGSGIWEVKDDLICEDWDNDWGGGEYGCSAYYREGDTITYTHVSGSKGNYPEGEFTVVGTGNVNNL